MQPPNQLLASEAMACADALRSIRTRLCQLVHDGHAVSRQRETAIVLIDGLNVASSLECLAGVLSGLTQTEESRR